MGVEDEHEEFLQALRQIESSATMPKRLADVSTQFASHAKLFVRLAPAILALYSQCSDIAREHPYPLLAKATATFA